MAPHEQRATRRHNTAYRVLRRLVMPMIAGKLNIQADPEPDLKGPAVVLCNHVTELDFIFAAKVFKTPLSFVTGRGLLQKPLMRFFMEKVIGVIPKQKGASDPSTTMTMLRRVRQGLHVCLFAEGNTTFNGTTGPFHPATGGLVKVMGATLVTLRIEGAYFALPRWGKGIRRGRTAVKVAGVYAPETLAEMNAEEVNDLIARDIFEDAHARQEREQVAYHGKNTARGLEHALYLCPECQNMNTLAGEGENLSCTHCKTSARLSPLGKLEGGFRHNTILAWTDWQKEELRRHLEAGNLEQLPFDEEQALFIMEEDGSYREIAKGPMAMDGEGLVVGSFEALFPDIQGFEIYRKNTVQFTLKNGRHYQTGLKPGFNALKYRDLFELVGERKG